MTPTLIVLALLVFGVAIIVFATRQRPGASRRPVDPKTGWDAPITPADAPVVDTELTRPDPGSTLVEPTETKEARR